MELVVYIDRESEGTAGVFKFKVVLSKCICTKGNDASNFAARWATLMLDKQLTKADTGQLNAGGFFWSILVCQRKAEERCTLVSEYRHLRLMSAHMLSLEAQ